MKLLIVSGDALALGAMLGAAEHYLPAVAALLGVIWYTFVIYDRVKYGPDIEGRLLWQYRKNRRIMDAKSSPAAPPAQPSEAPPPTA